MARSNINKNIQDPVENLHSHLLRLHKEKKQWLNKTAIPDPNSNLSQTLLSLAQSSNNSWVHHKSLDCIKKDHRNKMLPKILRLRDITGVKERPPFYNISKPYNLQSFLPPPFLSIKKSTPILAQKLNQSLSKIRPILARSKNKTSHSVLPTNRFPVKQEVRRLGKREETEKRTELYKLQVPRIIAKSRRI
uniref:Uncharacterized protein n=1 Tax=Euplotes crassus TaxID=5936 RepID=A0A7S3KAG2_EUPCR|mmetsp:Transcript_17247/g.16898  ORF Transcript_17247/g.16898 Transcript_17247/m.16898 type:complete len:191 (+) Transcript_17247:223-795(+)